MAEIISRTKQVFNGRAYYLCGQYYQRRGKRLHRAVWEFHHGKIPAGYHIHHKDGDRANNDIANLELMAARDHMSLHSSTPEAVERSKRAIEIARVYAAAWHKTPEARRLQSIWAKAGWEKKQEREYTCQHCGGQFKSRKDSNVKFCSNACKSAYRRKIGADDETRICVICGKEFTVNKYAKSRCCSRACAGKASARKRRGIPQPKRRLQYGGCAAS